MKKFSEWVELKEKLDGMSHQARAIDHRRLSSKLGTLDTEDFIRVKTGFHTLYR